MQPTAEFDPRLAAKKLLREGRSGALATLMRRVGRSLLFAGERRDRRRWRAAAAAVTLAVHTKNILADPRVSLMLDERKAGDPLEGARRHADGRALTATDDADVRGATSRAIRRPRCLPALPISRFTG